MMRSRRQTYINRLAWSFHLGVGGGGNGAVLKPFGYVEMGGPKLILNLSVPRLFTSEAEASASVVTVTTFV